MTELVCPINHEKVQLTLDSRPQVRDVNCEDYRDDTMMCRRMMPDDYQDITHWGGLVARIFEQKLVSDGLLALESRCVCVFRRDEFKRLLIVRLINHLREHEDDPLELAMLLR